VAVEDLDHALVAEGVPVVDHVCGVGEVDLPVLGVAVRPSAGALLAGREVRDAVEEIVSHALPRNSRMRASCHGMPDASST
jgi:hypothetical protein